MRKIFKNVVVGVLGLTTLLTIFTAIEVYASELVYTDSTEKAGTIVIVDNTGNIVSNFEEGILNADGELAYCIDINTLFESGYKARYNATEKLSNDQIADVALSLEYVRQYANSHPELTHKQVYLLEQSIVWRNLSVHLGWGYDNVRVDYSEISEAIQSEVYNNAKTFVTKNKDRYDYGGYVYLGEGQDLGQFWATLVVGKATIKKSSTKTNISKNNDLYSLAGAKYTMYSDKDLTKEVVTFTTDGDGNTNNIEVRAGTYYVKETEAPAGFQIDETVYPLTVSAGETATLKVTDTPKVATTLIELFKIDMETGKSTPQGTASLEGATFEWKYYDGYYTKDNLPSEATRTWTTKTIAETDSDGTINYITKLDEVHKVSGDSFYTQNNISVLPLGTITVEEINAPNGYLLEGAYMQADDSSEQFKGVYVAQITEDGEFAVLSGSNQYSVSDKVIRGGVSIQKRDLETKDTKAQGSAILKDAEFTITTLNENPVLVNGKLYNQDEAVLTIHTNIKGIASTSDDTLPHGKYRIDESKSPTGYLLTGAVPREFEITKDGEMIDLTTEATSIYNQIKRGDIEGIKIGAVIYKRLAGVPFKITSKTTGENHIVVTDDNGQFSTSASWTSHKQNTNAGISSEDGIWFGTSEPDDSKGALLYDTYEIEELRSDSNKEYTLIPPFDIIVSKDKTIIDLGTLTNEYKNEIMIHTTAIDKETSGKTIVAGKDVTIIDTVTLEGLTKGTDYILKGWQMIKDEQAELIINGELIENDYNFTADKENMEVQISFTFDASELGRKQIVTFEELYDMSNPEEPIKVAEHKDIEDEGQTITITEVSKSDETGELKQPDTTKTSTLTTSDLPNTGDTRNIAIFILGVIVSLTTLGIVYLRRKK